MTEITSLAIEDVKLVHPPRFGDERGFFSETYRQAWIAEVGGPEEFVQDNHAFSAEKGVLRGLHFQIGPSAQTKLVRVTRGMVLDVAVDIRHGSPTYGQYVSAVLSAENWHQLLVPQGFAHGYLTMTPDCEVLYKVDRLYDPARERAIRWNDPQLAIDWQVDAAEVQLSLKDREAPLLTDLPVFFEYAPGAPYSVICHDMGERS
jgi:dTDP-4-dehydrorhamnose 3,5-epimerase